MVIRLIELVNDGVGNVVFHKLNQKSYIYLMPAKIHLSKKHEQYYLVQKRFNRVHGRIIYVVLSLLKAYDDNDIG